MAMNFKTATALVSAYGTVQRVDDALTALQKAAGEPGLIEMSFTVATKRGTYNADPLFNGNTFHGAARQEIVDFLIMARRRQLLASRAEAIRTINQCSGVEPAPHPYAI